MKRRSFLQTLVGAAALGVANALGVRTAPVSIERDIVRDFAYFEQAPHMAHWCAVCGFESSSKFAVGTHTCKGRMHRIDPKGPFKSAFPDPGEEGLAAQDAIQENLVFRETIATGLRPEYADAYEKIRRRNKRLERAFRVHETRTVRADRERRPL